VWQFTSSISAIAHNIPHTFSLSTADYPVCVEQKSEKIEREMRWDMVSRYTCRSPPVIAWIINWSCARLDQKRGDGMRGGKEEILYGSERAWDDEERREMRLGMSRYETC
jgi:hypothetical protein